MNRKYCVLLILCLSCTSTRSYSDNVYINLTASDKDYVREQLDSFEKGHLTLDDITFDRDEAWGRKLVAYFYAHTNSATIKSRLPVSRCLAGFGSYPEAVRLAQEYVSVYSNDWHGWRIIGSANMYLEDYSAALRGFTNAVNLGDNESCASLGAAALKANRLDIFRDYLSRLMLLKNSETRKSLQAVAVLLVYSLRTEQQEVFTNALKGVALKDILAHDDVTYLVKQGCQRFDAKETEELCAQLERATQSTTNASSASH